MTIGWTKNRRRKKVKKQKIRACKTTNKKSQKKSLFKKLTFQKSLFKTHFFFFFFFCPKLRGLGGNTWTGGHMWTGSNMWTGGPHVDWGPHVDGGAKVATAGPGGQRPPPEVGGPKGSTLLVHLELFFTPDPGQSTAVGKDLGGLENPEPQPQACRAAHLGEEGAQGRFHEVGRGHLDGWGECDVNNMGIWNNGF